MCDYRGTRLFNSLGLGFDGPKPRKWYGTQAVKWNPSPNRDDVDGKPPSCRNIVTYTDASCPQELFDLLPEHLGMAGSEDVVPSRSFQSRTRREVVQNTDHPLMMSSITMSVPSKAANRESQRVNIRCCGAVGSEEI